MNSISQPRQLALTGFALPYLVIMLFAGIIISIPGTADEKTAKIGFAAFLLPFIAAAVGAILVGIGSIKKEKIEAKRKSLINAFIFGCLWTAVFHFFITLYLFMQIVYVYAGLKH